MTKKVRSLIPNEDALVKNNLNVMLIGPHGTGKTESVRALAERHGLKVKSFSCATLDPYTELLGVPMPMKDADGKDVLKMVRPTGLEEADILFFDELNRARPETKNAVFEIINNKTINGEPLPKLRSCWAAINPPDGEYDVDDLDPALIDRFDIYLNFQPRPSIEYMEQHMELETAKKIVQWWHEHNTARRQTYLSPRRLVKLGIVFERVKNKASLVAAMPPGGIYDANKLWLMLTTGATADPKMPGVKSYDFSAARSLAEILEISYNIKYFHRTSAKMIWRGTRLENFEEQLSVEEMIILLQSCPKRIGGLRKGFSWAMGFGTGSNPTYMDGSRRPSDRERVQRMPKLHEAINYMTKRKSSMLPPLSSMMPTTTT